MSPASVDDCFRRQLVNDRLPALPPRDDASSRYGGAEAGLRSPSPSQCRFNLISNPRQFLRLAGGQIRELLVAAEVIPVFESRDD